MKVIISLEAAKDYLLVTKESLGDNMMEKKELDDALRNSSNVAWSLGGFGIVYVIFSMWIVNMIHKLL